MIKEIKTSASVIIKSIPAQLTLLLNKQTIIYEYISKTSSWRTLAWKKQTDSPGEFRLRAAKLYELNFYFCGLVYSAAGYLVKRHTDLLARRSRTLKPGKFLLQNWWDTRREKAREEISNSNYPQSWLIMEIFIDRKDPKQLKQKQKIWTETKDVTQEIMFTVEL